MIRTHDAGSLRAEHIGQQVTLAGWVARRRDHGGVAFIDLREASGVVQVVVREEVAHQLRAEFVLKVVGTVQQRPEGNENANIPTGAIEVIADDVEILSTSAPLPFPIDESQSSSAGSVGEEVRLKYRYLDLRREAPAKALRLRSKVNSAARLVLGEQNFVEIETPTLTRSTPEGARDFLVPARLAPSSWYALPQSPQLFKQLLMVAGMERYYQIARCYRDEDFLEADEGQRREEHHRSLGKIEHARGLVDQHKAEGHQRVHHARQQPANQHFNEKLHVSLLCGTSGWIARGRFCCRSMSGYCANPTYGLSASP